MKRIIIICSACCIFSMVSVRAASTDSRIANSSIQNDPGNGAGKSISPFSERNATIAFNNFYTYFYSQEHDLFYTTSDKKEIAQGWTQAIFFDIALDNYTRTKKPSDLQKVRAIYQGAYKAYYAFNWNDVKYKNGFIYDDMMWWVIALVKAYNVTKEQHYLDTAKSGFNFIWNEAYDAKNGGMKWSWKVGGKNACINYPTVIAAMMLYGVTRKPGYLDKAKNIYQWSRVNLFQANTGRVADHKIGNDAAGFEDYTYNQGTCIGAAVLLYKSTNNITYLQDAKAAAGYTKSRMCDANGILPAEGDFNEQGTLKAIFAQYIYLLIYDAGQRQYLPWIKNNIIAAWKNRDEARNLMYRNYTVQCPKGMIQSYEACSGVAFMQLFNPKIGN